MRKDIFHNPFRRLWQKGFFMSQELYPTPCSTLELEREDLDLKAVNAELAQLTPLQRIEWAKEQFGDCLVLPTAFGPTSPILLKLVSQKIPDIPVVTIRHGYETSKTLGLSEWYEKKLDLDLHIYEAPVLPVPETGTPEFYEFQEKVKVEPFQRMLDDLRPKAYFSGVMRWQTQERKSFSFIEDKGSVLAINPVLDMTEHDVEQFFLATDMPRNDNYFDPTKGEHQNLECKLNTNNYQ
jgi:phosphoadenosine phosphosulfate reductase